MSESGELEAIAAPEDQAAPRERAVPRVTLVGAAFMAAAALAIGVMGTWWIGGGLGTPDVAEPTELRTGDAGQRAAEITGGTPEGSTTEAAAGPQAVPGAETAPETSPADDAFAARLAEEEARLAERARQAWDSPLTPSFTEAGEFVERWRPKDPEPVPATGTAAAAPAADGTAGQAAVAAAAPAPQSAPDAFGIGDSGQTHVLVRGSVIPAVLESSIDSDLPGLVRAKVAETVFDTLSGQHVLIPRGSWLVGTYGSNARAGQRRLFVAWTDLLLPDGTPIPLGGTGSLGADAASGIKGRRSTGIWTALGAAVLFDIAGNASQIMIARETGQAPGRGGLAELLGLSTGNSVGDVAQRYIGEILDRGTRFRVDAGARMNVLVEEDMHLPAQPVRGAWR